MFKCFVVVFAAMVLLAGPSRAEPLNPQAFTAAFAKAAATAMPDAKVTVTGELSTDTRSAKGETTTSDLHNAYRVYLGRPQDLETVIANYVRILVDAIRVGDNPGLDRSRIVPVLKPTAWLEGIRKDRQSQGIVDAPEPLTETYNSELIIAYAEDRPSSIRYLTTRDDVGGDRVKLFVLALGNLHRLLPKIEMRQGADGILLIEAGGDYEASLLLADNIWSSRQIQVDGDIVAAVPAKDALLVTGSHNRTGLKKLRAIAAELAAGPYGLSSALFVYRDGKFKMFGRK
jgi:uncharacterized protein YtpQ (UPF0354 family)